MDFKITSPLLSFLKDHRWYSLPQLRRQYPTLLQSEGLDLRLSFPNRLSPNHLGEGSQGLIQL